MDIYPTLEGDGKITRHINIKTLQDIEEKQIKDIIAETLVLNMEAHELKKLNYMKNNVKQENCFSLQRKCFM